MILEVVNRLVLSKIDSLLDLVHSRFFPANHKNNPDDKKRKDKRVNCHTANATKPRLVLIAAFEVEAVRLPKLIKSFQNHF